MAVSQAGRKIAIDISIYMYDLIIACGGQLTIANGENTSHLYGMFYRTIHLLENGIKPLYVFDGKPPDMKAGVLAKRGKRPEDAQMSLYNSEKLSHKQLVGKCDLRLVGVTKKHSDEVKKLLQLMGVPYVEASCEAEAQCAALERSGLVYAVATEDMDALTFGSSMMLKHLPFSGTKKKPVQEYNYEKVLEGFELTSKEFIDLCILLGCDYCESIKGIGPKRAVEFIKTYSNIETILLNIDRTKYTVPDNWKYQRARELFLNPDIIDPNEIHVKWIDPDEEGLVKFLCDGRGFNDERVRAGAKKIFKSRNVRSQCRLDRFFKRI